MAQTQSILIHKKNLLEERRKSRGAFGGSEEIQKWKWVSREAEPRQHVTP